MSYLLCGCLTKSVQGVAPVACDAGWLTEMHNRFEPEINKVKGLAIGMAVGVGRDMITQSAPEVMKAGLTDVIDGITVKLGGEPIHGPVLKASACPAAEGRRQRTE